MHIALFNLIQFQPSQVIEFQFLDFDVSCFNGGLLSVIDGWELNGQFFPSEKDHMLTREERYTEFCGDKVPYTKFVTEQNVGLIEFRIPRKNEGFRVKVIFHDNSTRELPFHPHYDCLPDFDSLQYLN